MTSGLLKYQVIAPSFGEGIFAKYSHCKADTVIHVCISRFIILPFTIASNSPHEGEDLSG